MLIIGQRAIRLVAQLCAQREISAIRSASNGEQVYAALKAVRDIAAFVSHRLIVRDSQGISCKKVETYSLPWKSVNMWSIENAGTLDFNSEVELWRNRDI